MARPTKYTPDTATKILDALREGKSRVAACGLARVTDRTLERWMARYVGFVDAIHEAEAEAEAKQTANLLLAAEGGALISKTVTEKFNKDGDLVSRTESEAYSAPNVTASTFWLERRRNRSWRNIKSINVSDLTDAQVIALLEAETPDRSEAQGTDSA
jgi:hypothetical protein